MAEVPILLTVEQRTRQIAHAYPLFRSEFGLTDTPLARMAYFSRIKREYLNDPLSNQDDQFAVLDQLDSWMRETKREIAKLPPITFNQKIHFETSYPNSLLTGSTVQ